MMGRRVAVVAAGQTRHGRARDDATQADLLREAAGAALAEAGLRARDVDAFLLANMELFEGRALPELWLAEGLGAAGRPLLKVATGGTSGTSAVIAGIHQVASGCFDLVMVAGVEKHSEGHTQTGMALTDPLWDRRIASGAVGNFALSAAELMRECGVSEHHAALVAVKARRNAARNPHAHLRMPELTVEEVLGSRMLAEPIRLLDMCPQSDGACALLLASEERARSLCPRPAWVRATATRHDKPYLGDLPERLVRMRTLRDAAAAAYRDAGISDPLADFDLAEIYEPVSYAELAWYEALGLCEPGHAGELIEAGTTALGGPLPVNPSGGVLSTNPVGASGVIRAAEAALQIHGRGGERQVEGATTALVTGYGVYSWSDVIVLSAEAG